MALSLVISPSIKRLILLRGIERFSILLFLVFRYRVVFLDSFFLSILSFIRFSICFLLYAVARNYSLLGLFVRIMYLGGIIVLFSYSFILSDVKVRFSANPLNVILLVRLVLFLTLDGSRVSTGTDVLEVYGTRYSTLVIGSILLYAVLRVCLSLCLRAHTV